MRVTMNDIAKRAGVSQTLVSFVINNNEKELKRVSLETQQRVRDCAAELNYTRNALATSVKTGKSRIIGILVPDMTIEFHARVIEGIMEAAEKHDYTVKVIKLSTETQVEGAAKTILEYRLSGLFFLGTAQIISTAVYKNLQQADAPIAQITSDKIQGVKGPRYFPDDEMAMTEAIQHLTSLGHTKIAYLAPTKGNENLKRRLQAFRKVMKQFHLRLPKKYIVPASLEEENEVLETLLAGRAGAPSAIICYSDLYSLKVIETASRLAIKLPDELSIVGFDDNTWAKLLTPALTVIRQNAYELGNTAMDELVMSITNKEIPLKVSTETLMPVTLVARSSTTKYSS